MTGNKKVNLRQLVEARAEQLVDQAAEQPLQRTADQFEQEPANRSSQPVPLAIQEIRHREISTQEVDFYTLSLDVIPYETTSTREFFLQWVTPENKIAGFLRLSLPKPAAFETYAAASSVFSVYPDEAMIREVHVYGRVSSLHKVGTSAQHRGLGRMLVERACQIAKENGYQKINVISAIGTRAYYRKLGFADNGLYQQKIL